MEATKKIKTKLKTTSLCKNKNFLFLWGGSAISLFGLQIYMIVMPLLIYDLSQSALAMSGIRVMEILPNVLLGMVAGVIVDRVHRKKIMTITVLVQWLAIGGILLLLLSQGIQLWSLFLLGFLFSGSGYFFGNAYHSSLPQIIAKEQLTEANAKLSFMDTMIRMVGPGITGFILAATTFEGTLFIQFICISILLIFLTKIRIPPVERQNTRNSFWMDLKEGIKELFGNKLLLTPTIAILFVNLASSMVIGVLLFFAVDIIGATESQIGLMLSFGALGGLLGALAVKKILNYIPRGKLFTYSLVIEIIGFTILIFANTWWVIGISLAIRTFAVSIVNIIYLAARQEFTPNHLLGRVSGTSSMLMKLAMPVGLLFAGIWAEILPIRPLFLITVVIVSIIFMGLLRTRFYQVT
ncbi:MFS family permease [Evansella vedderi]|uniref:MFS family permease n=1 Tax=Evansella vedderi TaxID=38282 RepID=A0ABT9ZYK1_9BACI|nr:MFS transporter [Evansella vedderi]MDQ0256322.1 MFS family permease [Evansella vedderi]